MERVVHVARSFEEARAWEIEQERQMTPAERQAIARTLRIRVYGENPPDVRASGESRVRRSLLP